jgi:DNA-binding transcriptional regulator YiaG
MTSRPNRGNVKDSPAYIKTFRKRHGLPQVQLAGKLHVEETTVQRWEAGDRTPAPYLKRALRDLARELETTN